MTIKKIKKPKNIDQFTVVLINEELGYQAVRKDCVNL
jgi:hypothetical protein